MKTIARISMISVLFLVAACVPVIQPTSLQATLTPQGTVVPATEVATMMLPTATLMMDQNLGLNVEKLQNFEYFSPNFQKPIQMSSGLYTETTANGTVSAMVMPQMAIGDLNGDQVEDGAVLLAESGGGTGVFVSLIVVVSQNGQYQQIAEKSIDDRPIIQSMTIADGAIILDATVHGINDTMAEPTLHVVQTYQLLENHLTLVKQASTFQGGSPISIYIESPKNGEVIADTLQIKGSMPSAPFENSLRFSIFDLAGTPLVQENFMVTSTDVGKPATFDNPISLPVLPSGSMVRLELAELSMANGNVTAMDSVLVKIK